MRITIAASGVCALVAVLAACSASADTAVLSPAQDTTLFSQDSGAGNGAGAHLFVGNTVRSNGLRRSLLSFDLSEIPAGAVVESVALDLRADQVSEPSAFALTLYRVSSSWGEGSAASAGGSGAPAGDRDATWTRRFRLAGPDWTQAGGDFVATASATTNVGPIGSYRWSDTRMADDLQAWLDTPTTNFGWILIGNETTSGSAKRFISSENAAIVDRPTLAVTYAAPVPEPQIFAMLVCGLGLIGFALRSHQRKANAAKLA